MTSHTDLFKIANHLADIARQLAQLYFRKQWNTKLKEDLSPITEVDLAIESAIREYLNKVLPHHGILGEEYRLKASTSEYCWIIDPIDGTASFTCGKPTFCTLIALIKNNIPIIGIIDQPIIQERWHGILGSTTTYNQMPCATQTNHQMIRLSCTTPLMFNEKQQEKFLLVKNIASIISYGGDGYAYGLLASGFIDIIFEANLKPYDVAALIPIIEGAGGNITDWYGHKIDISHFNGTVLATSNQQLHEKVLNCIN